MGFKFFIGIFITFVVGISLGYFAQLSTVPTEQISPSDHVNEESIHLFNDRLYIELPERNISWTRFSDTHSMEPYFNSGHHGIAFTPKKTTDIHVGDIITFTYQNNVIAHRVVRIANDKQGWYAETKGDNNSVTDPGKRRFSDIHTVYFALIY